MEKDNFYTILRPGLVLLLGIILFSCEKGSKKKESAENLTEQTENSGLKQDFPELVREMEEKTEEWNRAINERDYEKLGSFYSREVFHYRDTFPDTALVSFKKRWIAQRPGYEQRIQFESGSFSDETFPPAQIRIDFLKSEIVPGDTYDFGRHLIFRQEKDDWKIVDESDWPTDFNRAKAIPLRDGTVCMERQRTFWEEGSGNEFEIVQRNWFCELVMKAGKPESGWFEYYDGKFDTNSAWEITGGETDRNNLINLEMKELDEAGKPMGEIQHLTITPISEGRFLLHPLNHSGPKGTILLAGKCP